MAKDSPKGKVIDFRTARKSSESSLPVKATANGPSPRGGFLDAWLKNHEDSQSLIHENLSLKQQQRLLEDERNNLVPSTQESILFYVTLAAATLVLIAALAAIVVGGAS